MEIGNLSFNANLIPLIYQLTIIMLKKEIKKNKIFFLNTAKHDFGILDTS